MNVLLRHPGIGLYYAGRRHWAGNRRSARDFQTVARATAVSRKEDFSEMQIIIVYGDSASEIVLPVKRRKGAKLRS